MSLLSSVNDSGICLSLYGHQHLSKKLLVRSKLLDLFQQKWSCHCTFPPADDTAWCNDHSWCSPWTGEHWGGSLFYSGFFFDIFGKFWKYLCKLSKKFQFCYWSRTPQNWHWSNTASLPRTAKEMQNVLSFKAILSAVLKIIPKRKKPQTLRY